MPSRATHSRADAARSTGPELHLRLQVEPGQLLQLADQLAQAGGLGADELGRFGPLLGRGGGAVAERGGEALDRGDRRAELVRDVGQELALAVVGRLQPLGHAVERLAQAPELVVALVHAHVEAAARDGLGAVGEVAHRAAQAAGDAARQRPDQGAGDRDAADDERRDHPVRDGRAGVGALEDDLHVAAGRRGARLEVADRVAPVHDLALHQHHQVGVADEALRVAGAAGRAGDAAAVDLLGDGGRLLLERDLDLGARPPLHDPAEAQHDQRHDRQRHQDRQGDAGADRPRLQPAQERPHAAGSSL